ncbi:MAG: TIGR03663 family protein [Planctomycetes bacterium]|nr:TIGR03663 family protein [Planctomycetota bacterium]
MKDANKRLIIVLAIVVAAVFLRLPKLEMRPMHTDEAVHAIKFGQLLEDGQYRYDRNEYHGPTLNYLTLIPAWLGSDENLNDIDEFTVRIIPVVCGVLLVLLPLLLVDGIGFPAAVWIMAFTAMSPAFVFYSRYYIQEMLLVCFTFAAIAFGFRYTQNKNFKWALLTGISVGLMHATKETCIIAFGSFVLAWVFTYLLGRREDISTKLQAVKPLHVLAAILAAIAVSILFYSSFFKNPEGIFDSVRTYATYFSRASQNPIHNKSWYYYFDILTWVEGFEKITFNEDYIVVAACFGFFAAISRKYSSFFNSGFVRFIAFYTLIMTVIYSAIPYKTPWSMLGFFHGMVLLSGIGTDCLIKIVRSRWEKVIVWGVIILFGLISPLVQSYLSSFKYYADTSNPYVYAHTSNDIFDITKRVEQISAVHPDGRNMYIEVVCPDDDYWPLPWYLRSFANVGWWNKVDAASPAAELIIAAPEVEQEILKKLYETPEPGKRHLYVPVFDSYSQLRPQVELKGFVRKSLWDRLGQAAGE